MNPAHERYARTPPSNSLEQFFRLLDEFDEGGRSALASLCLDVLDHWIKSAVDPLEALKDRCRTIAKSTPQELLVQQVVIGSLWRLHSRSGFPPSANGRTRRDRMAAEAGQRTLFPIEDEEQRSTVGNDSSLYEAYCNAVRKHLLTVPTQDTHEESVALLALSEIRGVGYWTLRKLVQKGSLAEVFSLPSTEEFNKALRAAGSKGSLDTKTPIKEWRERAFAKGGQRLEEFAAQGISLIHRCSPDYPTQLNDLDDPPEWLFVQGDVSVLHHRSIAVVGTRTPTAVGIRLAEIISHALPRLNSALVSGLAEGIDQTMHLGSLQHNVPTIAVLGTGILNNFPSGSESIRSEICSRGGAIITEYLPRDSYSSQNFVRRNRIQAGLATVVVPVEWRVKSGTAHTVRFAHETERGIVCVKPTDWETDNRPELRHAREIGASIFTLPDELEQFVAAVSG